MSAPSRMRALVLHRQGERIAMERRRRPRPGRGELALEVAACGICRTDLHIVDGELGEPKLPLILGHQIVGHVVERGSEVDGFEAGDRVGVPWLGWTCGECRYCRSGRENLCERARFTGYQLDGGFAEHTVADARFCFQLPRGYPDLQAARCCAPV